MGEDPWDRALPACTWFLDTGCTRDACAPRRPCQWISPGVSRETRHKDFMIPPLATANENARRGNSPAEGKPAGHCRDSPVIAKVQGRAQVPPSQKAGRSL